MKNLKPTFKTKEIIVKFKCWKKRPVHWSPQMDYLKGKTLNVIRLTKKEQKIYLVKQTAFNFVSYKPRTEKQIRQKLRDKGYEKEEADLAIEFLIKFDFVDDAKYAKQFIADFLKTY